MRRLNFQVFIAPVFILAGLLLVSCGGGSSGTVVAPMAVVAAPADVSGYPGEPTSCTLTGQKLWLDAYMADQYFWSADRRVPNATAQTADAYFQSQLFAPHYLGAKSRESAAWWSGCSEVASSSSTLKWFRPGNAWMYGTIFLPQAF